MVENGDMRRLYDQLVEEGKIPQRIPVKTATEFVNPKHGGVVPYPRAAADLVDRVLERAVVGHTRDGRLFVRRGGVRNAIWWHIPSDDLQEWLRYLWYEHAHEAATAEFLYEVQQVLAAIALHRGGARRGPVPLK